MNIQNTIIGERHQPEPEPPSPVATPDHGVEHPENYTCEREFEQSAFGPVPEPRAPRLDGLVVRHGEPVPIHGDWQLEQVDRQQQQRSEQISLEDALLCGRLRPGAIARPEIECEDQAKDNEIPRGPAEIKNMTRAGILDRPL
jgi:hypothetical protein